MMYRAGIILVALLVASCGTTPPRSIIVREPTEVLLPVPAPCVPELPPEPEYPDNDLRDLDPDVPGDVQRGTNRLLAGREYRAQRIMELEAALEACLGQE